MRVLVSSTVGYGHVFPMVPLARALVAAGHDVLWATGEDTCRVVEAAGLKSAAAGATLADVALGRVEARGRAEGLRPEQIPEFVFPRMFGGLRAPRMLADLLPIARAFAPDLLVHEEAELAGALVAELLGIPSVTHSFGGGPPRSRLRSAEEFVAPLWEEHGLAVPPYAGTYRGLYIDIYPPSLRTVSLADAPAVQLSRPVAYSGPDGGLPSGLDGHAERPLVYITLGTVHADTSVLRDVVTAVAELPVRVLVTVGPQSDPALLGPQPDHVIVAGFVSQTDVLPHAAAVVSHAGSGTFLATLALGLPQVALPQAADQFGNAEALVSSGAGISLHPEDARSDAVRDAVDKVLVDPSYRHAAGHLRGEIAAMPSPEQVASRLETLVPAGMPSD